MLKKCYKKKFLVWINKYLYWFKVISWSCSKPRIQCNDYLSLEKQLILYKLWVKNKIYENAFR